jgi:hypothetical protein
MQVRLEVLVSNPELVALFNSRSDRIDRKNVPSDDWLLMRSAVGQTDPQK